MRDTKFILSFIILISLDILALYVLNFVSFEKRFSKDITQEFLTKLSSIDNVDIKYSNFVKKIQPAKVVVVEKEILKEVKVPIVSEKLSKRKVVDIKPAKEEYLRISSQKNIKREICSKLVTKFKKTNDYKIALKLSRVYYAKKDFKNSLRWATIANELNDKDDGSWILFAKSKIKLGEKDLAKKALLTYSKVYDSKNVRELLNRIDL